MKRETVCGPQTYSWASLGENLPITIALFGGFWLAGDAKSTQAHFHQGIFGIILYQNKTCEGQMSRLLRASILLLFLTSCGGGNFSAPQNLDDACSIVRQRPEYLRAMKSTQKKWGVPVYVQMAAIHQESKFIGNARTPHQYALGVIPMGRQSSAYGYSQALDGTWQEYQSDQRKSGARRDRITDSTDFMGWYMDETARSLGIAKSDATNQYLAYHEGRTGYANRSYESKSWLVDIANEVGARSQMYQQQLQACGRI